MPDCDEIRPECEVIMQNIADNTAKIYTKLDRLDQAVRGNGMPGLATRVASLEQIGCSAAKSQDRGWKIVAVAIAGIAVILTLINAIT